MENKNSTKTYPVPVGASFAGIPVRHDTTVPNKTKFAQNGITLIALVITIIILLILAGIVLNLTIGEHGIIKRAEQAGTKYEEASAREKLELALVDLQAQKVVDSTYNETTYIDSYLNSKQMIVIGDKVTVDGWQFEIDRSVPKIVIGLGKGEIEESTTIAINTAVTNADDYTKATIKIEITSDEEIGSIQINGEEIEVPGKVDGKYIVEKEVSNNGNYIINVKNTKNEYKTAKAQVTEISEDMDIQTVEQLVAFRDRVNKGATYEGRTVRLLNDLNLSSVCGNGIGNWEPIGTYISETDNKPFSGTFEGNNHTIDYLYINTTNNSQGLFGYVENGTIIGTIMGNNSNITGGEATGGIVGWIESSTIQNCGNNGTIYGTISVGGVIGQSNNSNIESCYNKANITANKYAGGITGELWNEKNDESHIKNSYNKGNIIGGSFIGGIAGNLEHSNVYNTYNTGKITVSDSRVGGIVGRLRSNSLVAYSYNLGEINNTGTSATVGGISGSNRAFDGSTDVKDKASTISYCYNSANVTSNGMQVGGICGHNAPYCYIKDSYRLDTTQIKYNSTVASSKFGTSSNGYLGRLVGYAYDTNTPYIENVYNETEEYMPTVYNVVNGLSDEESTYWSNTDVNAPTLLWEK